MIPFLFLACATTVIYFAYEIGKIRGFREATDDVEKRIYELVQDHVKQVISEEISELMKKRNTEHDE